MYGAVRDLARKRRILNCDTGTDWKLLKQIRQVVNEGGLESLASIRQGGADQPGAVISDKYFCLRTLFLVR